MEIGTGGDAFCALSYTTQNKKLLLLYTPPGKCEREGDGMEDEGNQGGDLSRRRGDSNV